MDIIKTA